MEPNENEKPLSKDEREAIVNDLKNLGFEVVPDEGSEDEDDGGIEMGDMTPKDLAPSDPACTFDESGKRSEIQMSEYCQKLAEEERRQIRAEELEKAGMTEAEYEKIKKTTPPKSIKKASAIMKMEPNAPPGEIDAERALIERLRKSPPTAAAFRDKCKEIKAVYDATKDSMTMGRHREIIPIHEVDPNHVPEGRYYLPPKPNGFFAKIIYYVCGFVCHTSLRLMNWLLRPTLARAERKRQERINSLIQKISSQMSDKNHETDKNWNMVCAIKDAESDAELERELEEISDAYDNSLWGYGRDSSSIMVPHEGYKTVKTPSGHYKTEFESVQIASEIQDTRKHNLADTIVVSPKQADDPLLAKAKELRIAELRAKEALTEDERKKLDELSDPSK